MIQTPTRRIVSDYTFDGEIVLVKYPIDMIINDQQYYICWCENVDGGGIFPENVLKPIDDKEYSKESALSNQWISVEDKLPQNNDDVLIICEYGLSIGEYSSENMWLAHGFGEVFNVTYWLSIPPLPIDKTLE